MARHIDLLKNKLHNIGARLLIDAAEQANELSGDGTTSCTVIAQSILEQGKRLEATGNRANFNDFRKGILDAVAVISKELDRLAQPVTSSEQLRQLALIASN